MPRKEAHAKRKLPFIGPPEQCSFREKLQGTHGFENKENVGKGIKMISLHGSSKIFLKFRTDSQGGHPGVRSPRPGVQDVPGKAETVLKHEDQSRGQV